MKNCRVQIIGGVVSLLSIASASYAQTGVTLYGVMDAGIEYANHQPNGGNSVVRMTPGNIAQSRFGLRGAEELGNGLKTLFVMESGFDSDTGKSTQGGRLFGRNAYVGLESRYGTVTLGRQTSVLFDNGGQFDPMYIIPRYSLIQQDVAMASRADNSIKYVGNFGGLKAEALYSFGADSSTVNGSEIPGNPRIGREIGGSLSYSAGIFGLGIAYDQVSTGTTTTRPDALVRRAVLDGTVAIGEATIYAGYRWAKAYDGAVLVGYPSGQSSPRSNLWWTGVRWSGSGPITLAAAAYYQDFARTNADPWMFVATGLYAFSKRTDAYLTAGYTLNKRNSALGLGLGGSGFDTVVPGANQFGTVLGVRHKF